MLSRNEYERVIEVFLVELNHLCMDATDKDLRSLPRLASEIDGYLLDFRDPANDADQILRCAFAYLDEYCGANRENVITAGYEAYKIAQTRLNQDGNSS